jgi:hypothetical protein
VRTRHAASHSIRRESIGDPPHAVADDVSSADAIPIRDATTDAAPDGDATTDAAPDGDATTDPPPDGDATTDPPPDGDATPDGATEPSRDARITHRRRDRPDARHGGPRR